MEVEGVGAFCHKNGLALSRFHGSQAYCTGPLIVAIGGCGQAEAGRRRGRSSGPVRGAGE